MSIYFFILIHLGRVLSKSPYNLSRIDSELNSWNEVLNNSEWISGDNLGVIDFALFGHIECICSGLTDEVKDILLRKVT